MSGRITPILTALVHNCMLAQTQMQHSAALMAHDSKGVIDKFMKRHWEMDKSHYGKIAKEARDICEEVLKIEGIKAEYGHRVKDDKRLRAKCIERVKNGEEYKSSKDIVEDVKDLAGVRIALYFPNQKTNVSKLIEQHFEVVKKKDHTGEEHKEYVAEHYYVHVRKSEDPNDVRPGIVEIQVMSVLMNAWSNVGHDIRYKALSGKPSKEEVNILSGLNSLLSTGDWFLETFHNAYIARVDHENAAFANHFELGAYLSKHFSISIQQKDGGMKLGSVKVMHTLLENIANAESAAVQPSGLQAGAEHQQFKLNTPKGLEEVIRETGLDIMDGSKFQELEREFDPCDVTISVCLMNHIVFKYAIASDEATLSTRKSYKLKLKIIISTIVWLDELFPSNYVFEDNIYGQGKDEVKRLLYWIHRHSEINQVILEVSIDDRREEKIKSQVEMVWYFLNDIARRDPIVAFGFRLAKSVLCEFPEEGLAKREKRQFPDEWSYPDE